MFTNITITMLHYKTLQNSSISKENRDEILNGKYSFIPPIAEGERIVLFHQLLLLVISDRNVAEKEINICHNLGLRLGLNTIVINEILKLLKKILQLRSIRRLS